MIPSPEVGEPITAIERLVEHFGAVVDSPCHAKVEHRPADILAVAVRAVVACTGSRDGIAPDDVPQAAAEPAVLGLDSGPLVQPPRTLGDWRPVTLLR